MAKSRTNRRFRKKSQKSLRKFSKTRKYKGGMNINLFLALLLSCTYLVDASFYQFLKGAAVTHAAIKVNKAIKERVQRERAPVAASTGNGGVIIGTVEQLEKLGPLEQLPTPPGQPTFAPELLVAVKYNDKTEFDDAVTQLEIENDNRTHVTSEVELKEKLDNFE